MNNNSMFPEPITRLPEADIPLKGVAAYLSQSSNHQVLFMEFTEDVELPEHSHAEQVGIVIKGKIDMTIDGTTQTYETGDVYFIPENVLHYGYIYAGYSDVTFFNEKNRYLPKSTV